jgi:lipopolysaccharide transport system permease protein
MWLAAPIVVGPTHGRALAGLGEVLRRRELVLFLAWRTLKVRYTQTVLGVLWVVLQPLLAMTIFTLVFGRAKELTTWDGPYALLALAALLPWQLFAQTLQATSDSIVGNPSLVTKVFFPRLALPLAAALATLVDFALTLVVFFVLLAVYGRAPSARLVALPAFIALASATALGLGLWLAALTARYRDARILLPFFTQALLFASPVVYSTAAVVPERWRPLYAANPLVGIIEGFRFALLGAGELDALQLAVSGGAALLLLASGLVYFQRAARGFADVL